MPIAMYLPHPERAVGAALVQFVLIGLLWWAMYAYARPRRGAWRSAMVLALGILVPSAVVLIPQMLAGLGEYGDMCRHWCGYEYGDAFLVVVEYFELYEFAVVSFLGLTGSLLVLMFVLGSGRLPTDQQEQAKDVGTESDPPGR